MQIQIDLPEDLNVWIEVQQALRRNKTKTETIIQILEEQYNREKISYEIERELYNLEEEKKEIENGE